MYDAPIYGYAVVRFSEPTYDHNGNATSTTGSNTTTYAWDFENSPSSVMLPGTGGTVSFAYDPFGGRIKKVSSAGTSVFAYDGDNLIEETNGSGAVVARYTQGLSIDEPLAMLRSAATSYYHADGLGSVTSLSNGAGSLAQTYTFDSFGKQTASSGSLVNPFQFTARDFDSETGLYYFRARYYAPVAGRFLSEDPMRFNASINFYAYVDDDPVNWMDPAGLDKVEVCCRPLRKAQPFLRLWHHCYIQITDSNGHIDTWGILPDKKGVQRPVKNDVKNKGGKCLNAPGEQCAIDKLRKGLDDDFDSGTYPSCGSNYHNWWWRFAGYNSNTYVYNMISNYGLTPPPEPRSPGYNPAPGHWYH
jgi:RHS repeat-associated protein